MQLTLKRKEFIQERDAVKNNKGSHAYIIEGSEGIGKFSYALAVSCVYFCKNEERPCLKCAQCRKVLEGKHPDLHVVEPEKGIIRVDMIREIISTLYETPYEGGVKIYIIKNFEKANEQAQNAFLKTLEEPPESAVFFLLTENSHMLLDTVKSRCKKIVLSGFDKNEILSFLKVGFPGENASFAAENCGGNIGRALKLINDENYLQLTKKAIEIANDKSPDMAQTAKILEKEPDILPVLREQLFNTMRIQHDTHSLIRLHAVEKAIEDKKKNINGGLVIERLAYVLSKGGTKWQR